MVRVHPRVLVREGEAPAWGTGFETRGRRERRRRSTRPPSARRLPAVHTADALALAGPLDVVVDRIEMPAFRADPPRSRHPLHDRAIGTAGLLAAGEE